MIITKESKLDHRSESTFERALSRTIAREPNATTKRVGSNELLGPCGQIIIDHRGEDYRLRITSKGKLLLTK